MRKQDETKHSIIGKAAKTINFDKMILERLEVIAKKENTSVSSFVNMLCKRVVLTDVNYHQEMARHYNLKMQNHLFLKEQALSIKEVN